MLDWSLFLITVNYQLPIPHCCSLFLLGLVGGPWVDSTAGQPLQHVAKHRKGKPSISQLLYYLNLSNIKNKRPASPTPAPGTMSTWAPTLAPSAASRPPSPSSSWANTSPSTTRRRTAVTTSLPWAATTCTRRARSACRRSTTRITPGPVA